MSSGKPRPANSCSLATVRNSARRFPESDAGVEHDLRFRNAGTPGDGHGLAQARGYVPHHISRKRLFLHGPRLAPHVHQDDCQFPAARDFCEPRVRSQGRHIVEDFGSRIRGSFGDFRSARVDGDGNLQTSSQLF